MRKTVAMLLAMAMTVSQPDSLRRRRKTGRCNYSSSGSRDYSGIRRRRDDCKSSRGGRSICSVRRFHNDSWTRPAGRKSPL